MLRDQGTVGELFEQLTPIERQHLEPVLKPYPVQIIRCVVHNICRYRGQYEDAVLAEAFACTSQKILDNMGIASMHYILTTLARGLEDACDELLHEELADRGEGYSGPVDHGIWNLGEAD